MHVQVDEAIQQFKDEILERRYRFPIGKIMGKLKDYMFILQQWCPGFTEMICLPFRCSTGEIEVGRWEGCQGNCADSGTGVCVCVCVWSVHAVSFVEGLILIPRLPRNPCF